MSGIAETVRKMAEPIAKDAGVEIWDVEYKKEGSEWFLRVFIDKPGEYVGIDDCEAVSRKLSDILDVEDPIAESYCLEVGSAGIDRPLKRESDFQRFLGETVEIRFYKATDGAKNYIGKLQGYDGGTVKIDDKEFKKGDYSQVRLYPEI